MAKGTKFDMNKPLGIAGGVWLAKQLESDKMPAFVQDLDPRMVAAGLVFVGDWLPKQSFAKNAIKNADLREGAGAGIQAVGILSLMEEFGMAGIGQGSKQLRDDDILAVAIEGHIDDDDDLDIVNADVLSEDYDDDDLDVVNDDVLSYDDDDDDDDDDYFDDDDDDDDDLNW